MENFTHKTLEINGIKLHVAETGPADGTAVLFLHGFPELWYSWRHQMLHLSAKGYRAIAPDLRGFGDSDAPPSPSQYTGLHIVGDLVALLDALGLDKIFLVGHDWGAIIAWWFCLFRPDRIRALVNMSVQFHQRHPQIKTIQTYRDLLGDGFYMCRFLEPGEAEKAFAKLDCSDLMKSLYSMKLAQPWVVPPEYGLEVSFQALGPAELPPWMTPEDIEFFANKYRQTGFTGGLNYYRAIDLTWEYMAPWAGAPVTVPVKFLIGDHDLTYHVPGVKEYIHEGGFKKDVPKLEEVVVMEGVGHFINQEKADEVNQHICEFIARF